MFILNLLCELLLCHEQKCMHFYDVNKKYDYKKRTNISLRITNELQFIVYLAVILNEVY